MKNTRRQFLIMSAAGAATLSLNNLAQAQAMVAETDPQAQALGYKADSMQALTKFGISASVSGLYRRVTS